MYITFPQEVANGFHNPPKVIIPDCLSEPYPSHIKFNLLPRAQGKGMGESLITCVLESLKNKGMCVSAASSLLHLTPWFRDFNLPLNFSYFCTKLLVSVICFNNPPLVLIILYDPIYLGLVPHELTVSVFLSCYFLFILSRYLQVFPLHISDFELHIDYNQNFWL